MMPVNNMNDARHLKNSLNKNTYQNDHSVNEDKQMIRLKGYFFCYGHIRLVLLKNVPRQAVFLPGSINICV